jgi:hypothetical protein
MKTVNLYSEQDITLYDVLAHVDIALEHWAWAVAACINKTSAEKVRNLRYILRFLWIRLSCDYRSSGGYLSTLPDSTLYTWVDFLTKEDTVRVEKEILQEAVRVFPGLLRAVASQLNTKSLNEAGTSCPLCVHHH